MKIADYIKSSIISKRAIKGNLVVEEVGLPFGDTWDKKEYRADVMEITKDDKVIIYEVKSSLQDFKSDNKWENYLYHCHLFYFVAPNDVIKYIKENVPNTVGLYKVDNYGNLLCERVSRNTGSQVDVSITRNNLQIQLGYRYCKIHTNFKKNHKKEYREIIKSLGK